LGRESRSELGDRR